MRLEPTVLPSTRDERAVGLGREGDLGDGGDDAGYSDAGDERERDEERRSPGRDAGSEERGHGSGSLYARPSGGDDHVDELDAHERRDDPAQTVDEQVAPQQLARRRGPERHAPQRERDERHDDQRVEDDRRQDRALGRGEAHDVEAVELGIDARRTAPGTIAKYFATSLAIENVVIEPRVMSSCLPMAMTSSSLVGSESRSTMLAASLRGRRAAVHGQADVGLGEGRGVVRAVAGHRHEVALGLLLRG